MEDSRTRAARAHFDRWSATYERDGASRWLREIQTAALQMLGLTPGDGLLDLACGTGAAVREAAATVTRAVGFDLSAAMIARARELAATFENVAFVEGDVSDRLPFADEEFTAVLCTTAFHHFPHQPETITEISRVLAPRRPAGDRRCQPFPSGRVRARPAAADLPGQPRRLSKPKAASLRPASGSLHGDPRPERSGLAVTRSRGPSATADAAAADTDLRAAVPAGEIGALASRFGYADDARLLETGVAARARGHYTREEFIAVCAWKAARSRSKVATNTEGAVVEATRQALTAADEATRLNALLELEGVGRPDRLDASLRRVSG